jgi:hypothetical protein
VKYPGVDSCVQNFHVFGQNENWILVYFPSKFLAEMRDTRIQFSFRLNISSAISAKIEGEKYHLLNCRFELTKIDSRNFGQKCFC